MQDPPDLLVVPGHRPNPTSIFSTSSSLPRTSTVATRSMLNIGAISTASSWGGRVLPSPKRLTASTPMQRRNSRRSRPRRRRSEEHTSELQSLMRISYADYCLKTKNTNTTHHLQHHAILYTHQS